MADDATPNPWTTKEEPNTVPGPKCGLYEAKMAVKVAVSLKGVKSPSAWLRLQNCRRNDQTSLAWSMCLLAATVDVSRQEEKRRWVRRFGIRRLLNPFETWTRPDEMLKASDKLEKATVSASAVNKLATLALAPGDAAQGEEGR